MVRRISVLFAFVGVLLLPASAGALTLDPIGTFSAPVFVTSDPADPDRLFVVERGGTIRVKNGPAAPTTFLDLTALDTPPTTTGERGLLSMAFAPDYATSGRFYVFYTHGGTAGSPAVLGDLGDLQVDEFTASGDSVDLETRRPLLTIEHSSQSNHNGGQLQIGPDGYLYIGTGDGGGGGDPDGNAQNLNSLLGKLLRIDPSEGDPYSIPADNPFVDVAGADEVWSYGLRNPWRFSFDRLTGDLLVGDVGQGQREEVDYEPDDPGDALSDAGRSDNFGWDCREGDVAYAGPPGGPSAVCAGLSTFTDPVTVYNHLAGRCSITGGYVVRDPSLGDLVGRYLFVDLCAGVIVSVVPTVPIATGFRVEAVRTVSSPSSFGEDSCGRVYIAELGTGVVSRFTGAEPAECGPAQRRLTVAVGGAGMGQVLGPGIACPSDCLHDYDEGTVVTLSQSPIGDSIFAGWGGDCAGTGSCVVTMSGDRTVTSTFDATPEPPPPGPSPSCGGEEATIEAEPGEATLGTPGADIIVGTPGPDVIRGFGGNDRICGRVGRDALSGSGGADGVKGGGGRDRLRGGAGPDRLNGGPQRDRCAGGPGRDTERSC